jgi:hypothetical protein
MSIKLYIYIYIYIYSLKSSLQHLKLLIRYHSLYKLQRNLNNFHCRIKLSLVARYPSYYIKYSPNYSWPSVLGDSGDNFIRIRYFGQSWPVNGLYCFNKNCKYFIAPFLSWIYFFIRDGCQVRPAMLKICFSSIFLCSRGLGI